MIDLCFQVPDIGQEINPESVQKFIKGMSTPYPSMDFPGCIMYSSYLFNSKMRNKFDAFVVRCFMEIGNKVKFLDAQGRACECFTMCVNENLYFIRDFEFCPSDKIVYEIPFDRIDFNDSCDVIFNAPQGGGCE